LLSPFLKAPAHEPDVAVEVHRLVGLVLEILVALALERVQRHVEALGQAPIALEDRGAVQPPGLGAALQRPGLLPQTSTLTQERELDEAAVAVAPSLTMFSARFRGLLGLMP